MEICEKYIDGSALGILKSLEGKRIWYMTFPCVNIMNERILFEKGKLAVLDPSGNKTISVSAIWHESEIEAYDYKEFVIKEEESLVSPIVLSGDREAESKIVFELSEITGVDIYKREHITTHEKIVYDAMIVFQNARGELISIEAPSDMTSLLCLTVTPPEKNDKFFKRLEKEFIKR